MKVICFGDSNTYGHDPRSRLGGRFPAESRWPDLLAAGSGWEIRNQGENGREIPDVPPPFPADTGLLIVMLGTNDLLRGRSPAEAAERMEGFLRGTDIPRDRILLIAPPPMIRGTWVHGPELPERSAALCILGQNCSYQGEALQLVYMYYFVYWRNYPIYDRR